MLLLPGLDVVAAELALAVAVDDLAVGRRADLAAFAPRRLEPCLRRLVRGPRERRHIRHVVGAVVLLRRVQAIRKLIVGIHHVQLRRRLVHLRRPAPSAILGDVRAAVVGLDHDFRIVGIDPDHVVVTVRRRHGGERPPAVSRMVKRQLGDVHLVLVLRIHVHLVEVKRPRAQRLVVVHERPGRAGVGRAVEAALISLRLHLRVDHARIRLADVDPHLADQIVGQAPGCPGPVVAAVDGLVDAAFAGGAAADDRPGLALRAPRARIQLVRVRPVDCNGDGAGLFVDEEHLLP